MKRTVNILLLVIAIAGNLIVVGYGVANASSADKMLGVVVAEGGASLDVADQPGITSTLVVDKVVAPDTSWVVVHEDMDGKPGARLGLTRVEGGTSTNVAVKMDPEMEMTEKVLVALHADRGIPGTFEFNMEKFESSPDKPYFINGEELAKAVVVRAFGVKAEKGEAAIEVADQPGLAGDLVVERAVAPSRAWIVVHLDEGGKPGERVGLLSIPAGETEFVSVELEGGAKLADSLLVAVHADRGKAGTFEFDMMDKVNSPDQPFFVDGKEVATAVAVR